MHTVWESDLTAVYIIPGVCVCNAKLHHHESKNTFDACESYIIQHQHTSKIYCVCLICIPYPWSSLHQCHKLFVFLQVTLPRRQPVRMCMFMYVVCVCVCVNLSVNQILGAQNASPCMTHTGCLRCTMRSQKGGELGLSILGCELRQWLDKAASGSQPITGLRSVFHSYGCMIGPGVAGRGMDKWSPFTESEREWSPSHSPVLMYTCCLSI